MNKFGYLLFILFILCSCTTKNMIEIEDVNERDFESTETLDSASKKNLELEENEISTFLNDQMALKGIDMYGGNYSKIEIFSRGYTIMYVFTYSKDYYMELNKSGENLKVFIENNKITWQKSMADVFDLIEHEYSSIDIDKVRITGTFKSPEEETIGDLSVIKSDIKNLLVDNTKNKINKIEYYNSMMMGNEQIYIYFNLDKKLSFESKMFSNNSNEKFTVKEDLDSSNVIKKIEKMNIKEWPEDMTYEKSRTRTDMGTRTIEVTYKNGETQKISCYGEMPNKFSKLIELIKEC